MSEINKRLLTSFLLVTIVLISLNQPFILNIILIYCLYQIFFEFYAMLNKIFNKNGNIKFILLLIIFLTFITYTIINVSLIFTFNYSDKKLYLYLIIILTIFTDIGGYIFGKVFKGKKLTKISPNKTYSGVIGSYILSFLVIYIFFSNYIEPNIIFIFTILISTISQIGDLIISYIKRKAKVKNTGSILPGHGGLLDRFDGLIFSIPLGLQLFRFVWIKKLLF